MGELSLTIPAKDEFLYLLRTVVASAAARANFSIDAIDDLRIAVDEAAAYLLQVPGRADKITLTVDFNTDSLSAVVFVDSMFEWPPTNMEDSLAWKVLSGLTDGAEFTSHSGHPAVALVKARTA